MLDSQNTENESCIEAILQITGQTEESLLDEFEDETSEIPHSMWDVKDVPVGCQNSVVEAHE